VAWPPIRILIGCAVILATVYVGDYVYLRVRMLHPAPSNPFETVVRTRLLAIPQKNGKVDYQIDQTQPVETLTCVHSCFPHYGNPPCWYLKPRLNQPIPVSLANVPADFWLRRNGGEAEQNNQRVHAQGNTDRQVREREKTSRER